MRTNFKIIVLLFPFFVIGQNDTVKKWNVSTFAEMYYSYDFSNPENHEKPNFIYNHKRHNELNANLLLVKGSYQDKSVRGNLALMAGNYAQYNLSSEPTWAQFIYEANVGIKLSKTKNIWLDAGIMPSHIGFESVISTDCWNLTRSLLAENSPYYETGAKLSYTNTKENLTIALFYLNGWQRIQKPNFIQNPSFGFQINYKPSDKLLLNYSNFLGYNQPDSLKAFRSFHNFYVQFQSKKIGITTGFDIGSDKYTPTKYGVWFAPIAVLRYELNSKTKIALRGEYYHDKNQIIIATNTLNGFQVTGVSSNLDIQINNKALFRIEGKLYDSKDAIFNNDNQNFSITTSLTLRL